MYMCKCIYICVYVSMYVCTNVCMYVCVYMFLCVNVYIYVCVYMFLCVNVYMYTSAMKKCKYVSVCLQYYSGNKEYTRSVRKRASVKRPELGLAFRIFAQHARVSACGDKTS